jgi:hypothetical protein
MEEDKVKKELCFLSDEYGFKYKRLEFTNYRGNGQTVFAYCYFNDIGCFVITDYPVIGEREYKKFSKIDEVEGYLSSNVYGNLENKKLRCYYDEILKHDINVYNYEKLIWDNNKARLFFGGFKYELKILSKVIRVQIERNGEFFGIAIKMIK